MAAWESKYADDWTPWDGGRAAPQLVALLDAGELPVGAGRALELGCGLAWNAQLLSERGFSVTGVDLAPTPLRAARRRMAAAAAAAARERRPGPAPKVVELLERDALTLALARPVDLVVDEQFFHILDAETRAGAYVAAMRRLLRPGGALLLLTGNAAETHDASGPPGLTRDEVTAPFAGLLDVERVEETRLDTAAKESPPLGWQVLLRRPVNEFNLGACGPGVWGAGYSQSDSWAPALAAAGAVTVVSLLRDDEGAAAAAAACEAAGLAVVHGPVSGEELEQLRPVVVHCREGRERTGAQLAAWVAVARGLSLSAAMSAVEMEGAEVGVDRRPS